MSLRHRQLLPASARRQRAKQVLHSEPGLLAAPSQPTVARLLVPVTGSAVS